MNIIGNDNTTIRRYDSLQMFSAQTWTGKNNNNILYPRSKLIKVQNFNYLRELLKNQKILLIRSLI